MPGHNRLALSFNRGRMQHGGRFSADVTPPVISSVAAANIGDDRTTVQWITDEAATSHVQYGETTAYGSETTLNGNYSLSHSETVTGLDPATLYHFRVISVDAAGNSVYSGDFSFTTTGTATGITFTNTYTLLTDIPTLDVTGTTDEAARINAWIASKTNGADSTHHTRLIFPTGTLLLSTGLFLGGKEHTTIEGATAYATKLVAQDGASLGDQGSFNSFFITGYISPVSRPGTVDVIVHDFDLTGILPVGTTAYTWPKPYTSACGMLLYDVVGFEAYNLQMDRIGGDGIFVSYNCQDVKVHDFDITLAGRNGIVIGGIISSIEIYDGNIDRALYFIVDIEPYNTTRDISDIVIRDITWGSWGANVGEGTAESGWTGQGFASIGQADNIAVMSNIEISGFSCTSNVVNTENGENASYYLVRVHNNPANTDPTKRLTNFVFKDNSATQDAEDGTWFAGNLWPNYAPIDIMGVDGLTVTGNTQPMPDSSSPFDIRDCTSVTKSGNTPE